MPFHVNDPGFGSGQGAAGFHLRHRGHANVLFADLHIAPQTTSDLSRLGVSSAYGENLEQLVGF